MIFLKKLSTAYDEDYSHKLQLQNLNATIQKHHANESAKSAELKKLQADKIKYKEDQDTEIARLEAELKLIEKNEQDSIAALEAKEKKDIQEENNRHEEKYKTMDNTVKEEKATLNSLESKNKETQKDELLKLSTNHQNYCNRVHDQYDSTLDKETKLLESTRAEYEALHAKLVKITDEYRRVKHEKEVNNAIETEWQIKIQVSKAKLIHIEIRTP